MDNNLPTGIITFLFTDIQGSTPLWEHEPQKMAVANAGKSEGRPDPVVW